MMKTGVYEGRRIALITIKLIAKIKTYGKSRKRKTGESNIYPGQCPYFLFSYQSVSDVGSSRLLQEISH